MTQQRAVFLLHGIGLRLALQIIVFVAQELHHIGMAMRACTVCAVLAWGCWSGGVKQSFVSAG